MVPERFQRAKEVFAAALEHSGSEQAAYLDGACAGDAALRAEVEALLASDQQAAAGPLAQALSEEGTKEPPTTPGAMIAGRYRIMALLGRGGMGEVYLAEDLTLGQQVALKFLSGHIEAREGGLQRFLDEVRVARRVGHPNVARVHDVGEADGRRFLSMEYVDGEDLSHLLKRIGRLPREKAEEIARQLCAGLDAIHAAHILHRDLKPANVMLDGDGNVRITDFGLAASVRDAEESDEVVGTPAYMAPEQLEGQPASERSEIFSLGLLLYELFTGKRAFKGRTFLELKAEYADQTPSSPSSVIADLDPTVEEAILACLRRDPQDRPPSVRAVALSLPGGDPLAAAVAAGKTPAPDVVADAADTSGMSPRVALLCLAGFLFFVALTVTMNQRVNHSIPPHSPDVLVKEARDFLAAIGHDVPRYDSIHRFRLGFDEVQRVAGASDNADGGGHDARARDRTFWYRESPRELFLMNQFLVEPRWNDPPHVIPGMVRMRMTTRGELRSFSRVPAAPLAVDSRETPDWTPFFEAAGLADLRRESVAPRWPHDVHSDAVHAWEVEGDAEKVAMRVEAASAGGQPAAFLVMRRDREPAVTTPPAIKIWGVLFLIQFLAVAGAMVLAARNLKLGRGDRKGATRVALCLFGALVISWVGVANHTLILGAELTSLRACLATALFYSVQSAIFYLAIEPFFRRLWPRRLVSWVRLLDGRFRDRLVGRDLLLGALVGSALAALAVAYIVTRIHLEPSWEAPPTGPPGRASGLAGALLGLSDPSYEIAEHLMRFRRAIEHTLVNAGLLVLLRLLLRRQAPAVCALGAVVFLYCMAVFGSGGLSYGVSVVFVALFLAFFLRVGILGMVALHFVLFTLTEALITLDLDQWYSGRSSVTLLVVLLVGGWGFWVTTAGRPMFRDELSDS